jgi:hypothetical protein
MIIMPMYGYGMSTGILWVDIILANLYFSLVQWAFWYGVLDKDVTVKNFWIFLIPGLPFLILLYMKLLNVIRNKISKYKKNKSDNFNIDIGNKLLERIEK